MIELLPAIAPLAASALLQSRAVRSFLVRLFPGAIWTCRVLPWLCK